MAGIIKNYGYQNISVMHDDPVMTTVYGKKLPAQAPAPQQNLLTPQQLTQGQFPPPPIARKLNAADTKSVSFDAPDFGSFDEAPVSERADTVTPADEVPVQHDDEPVFEAPPETVSVEEARVEREQLAAEYEAMRAHYEEQSEQYIIRARQKADEIYRQTKELAEKTILEAREEAKKIKAAAAEEGRKEGHEEGVKQGYDDGYTKALKKCKDSLLELKSLAESVTAEKNEIFMRYERQLFDAIFEIAQKITVNSLNQHDKGVITKMLREAGKKYKTSKHVTIMLSKLDMEQNAEIDDELIRNIFKNSENIEIEILPDAPKGTLIIDNGSEITDAGIATQLQIIEQLGSGKYRDKSFTELLKGGAEHRKQRQAKGDKAEKADAVSAVSDDDDVIPDVAYSDGSRQKPPASADIADTAADNADSTEE